MTPPVPALIKCVVWDIDNTLLTGTYLESADQRPGPDPELLRAARELDARGIVHALASKNPPSAADYVTEVTGLPFAAAECGWGRKSDAIRRITDDLGLAPDAVAFVDDDLLERAEVAAALPAVLVLSPEDVTEAASWPEFSPAVITAEGRRRGEMYARRRRRQEEARAFGGSRDDFLRQSGTRVLISEAVPADLPRLHELSVRTHQFNTTGEPVTLDTLAAWLGSAARRLITVRLRDQFGDDGIVGGALLDSGAGDPRFREAGGPARRESAAGEAGGEAGGWAVPLLMMSCRALGRGVLEALLARLCQQAAAGGAPQLRIPCLVTDRNVPLRLALAAAGFRAGAAPQPGEPALFGRPLTGPQASPLPALPDWAVVAGSASTADSAALADQASTGADRS